MNNIWRKVILAVLVSVFAIFTSVTAVFDGTPLQRYIAGIKMARHVNGLFGEDYVWVSKEMHYGFLSNDTYIMQLKDTQNRYLYVYYNWESKSIRSNDLQP